MKSVFKILALLLIFIGLFVLFDGNLYLMNKWFLQSNNNRLSCLLLINTTKSDFKISQCFRKNRCDHIELGFNDDEATKMHIDPKFIKENLQKIFIHCPNGCLDPIPPYSHHLNIANFIYLKFCQL